MSHDEILKRFWRLCRNNFSRIKYMDARKWPYYKFAGPKESLKEYSFGGKRINIDRQNYSMFGNGIDLAQNLNWYGFGNKKTVEPISCIYKMARRFRKPYSDIRVTWELNRLQFLPMLAANRDDLFISILTEWLKKNPFLHGPAYQSAMEVALRWISIYWAICLHKKTFNPWLKQSLSGLAIASGTYIENRLSTHSSAGNHLIVEAVGLFWVGMALKESKPGRRWIEKGRSILHEQIMKQIYPDGTNREQSFWYLGFVIDAVFHYFLLEDGHKIPREVYDRVEKAVQFIDDMTLSDGDYPDYGDRDDGFVFRISGNYDESPFPGLLNIGTMFLKRSEWRRQNTDALDRFEFWAGGRERVESFGNIDNGLGGDCCKPTLKTYPNGGMTLMTRGKGRLLFRHGRLGLGNTCGHGHADALSVLFWWDNMPVLIDLGSGQYNGDQNIRNYFRSTIAHNTVEIGNRNQAEILGPFLWKKPYNTTLHSTGGAPSLFAKASHDGYLKKLSVVHARKVECRENNEFSIEDSFLCPGDTAMRGAFHLGKCLKIQRLGDCIEADFGKFKLQILFSPMFSIQTFYGSDDPFIGWRSTVYGKWEPIHTVTYSRKLEKDSDYQIQFRIIEI